MLTVFLSPHSKQLSRLMKGGSVMRSLGETVAFLKLHHCPGDAHCFHLSVGNEDGGEEGTADNGQGGRAGPLQPPLL